MNTYQEIARYLCILISNLPMNIEGHLTMGLQCSTFAAAPL